MCSKILMRFLERLSHIKKWLGIWMYWLGDSSLQSMGHSLSILFSKQLHYIQFQTKMPSYSNHTNAARRTEFYGARVMPGCVALPTYTFVTLHHRVKLQTVLPKTSTCITLTRGVGLQGLVNLQAEKLMIQEEMVWMQAVCLKHGDRYERLATTAAEIWATPCWMYLCQVSVLVSS